MTQSHYKIPSTVHTFVLAKKYTATIAESDGTISQAGYEWLDSPH